MISTQLKKCLVVSVSALSALGLVTLMPYMAIAQTSGQTQTGVEGSQANPDSNEGSGQVVPPTNTRGGTPGTMTPGTMTPGTMTPGTMTPGTMTPGTMTPRSTGAGSSNDSNVDTIEGADADNTRDSNTGRGEVLDPAMEGGSGTMTPGTMTPGTMTPGTMTPGTMTPGSRGTGTGTMTPGSNVDVIEGDGASGARDSDTGRGEVLNPATGNGTGTMTPGSTGTGAGTTRSTGTGSSTTPTTTTPARTQTTPSPSSSPRALW